MSEKPFWEGKTCEEMAGLHVKVTFKDGSILTGKTNPDADIVVNYLTVRLSCRAGDDPFLPIRGIDTIELLDNPEYERIDNIEDVCEGDVYVAADGNKYTVISLTQSNLYPLRVMICKGTDYALPRDCFSHALRRKPKLPDKPGLWFDKEDTVWHFDGLFLRQLNDIEEAWSVTHVTRFAPFRPAKAVEA